MCNFFVHSKDENQYLILRLIQPLIYFVARAKSKNEPSGKANQERFTAAIPLWMPNEFGNGSTHFEYYNDAPLLKYVWSATKKNEPFVSLFSRFGFYCKTYNKRFLSPWTCLRAWRVLFVGEEVSSFRGMYIISQCHWSLQFFSS